MKMYEVKAILASYGRAFLVAALAVYATGDMNIEHMIYAGIAAIIGPAIRAINPNDPAFGRVSVEIEKGVMEWVDKLVESRETYNSRKKSAKKSAKKK